MSYKYIEHQSSQGAWLSNGKIEVFVAVEPHFRLIDLRRVGEQSVMEGPGMPHQGLRLAIMEPDQQPHSFATAGVPAVIESMSDRTARVRLAEAEGLSYTVDIEIDEAESAVTLRYGLTNLSNQTRQLAIWSVIAYEVSGQVVMPLDANGQSLRRIVTPRWSPIHQPDMAEGKQALLFDLDGTGKTGLPYKVGLATDAGWLAMARGKDVLISHVERQPEKAYPEGDANVTFFYFDRQQESWAETEQVGPLVTLGHNESTQMIEHIELIRLPQPHRDADALRQAIESKASFKASIKKPRE